MARVYYACLGIYRARLSVCIAFGLGEYIFGVYFPLLYWRYCIIYFWYIGNKWIWCIHPLIWNKFRVCSMIWFMNVHCVVIDQVPCIECGSIRDLLLLHERLHPLTTYLCMLRSVEWVGNKIFFFFFFIRNIQGFRLNGFRYILWDYGTWTSMKSTIFGICRRECVSH